VSGRAQRPTRFPTSPVRGPAQIKAHQSVSEVSQKQELAKLEPIEVFLEHQALSETPSTILPRQTCREMREAGLGYFISSGTQFRMASAQPELARAEPDWEALLRRYGIRDESVCPTAKTMFDYAQGMRRAVAIMQAWERNHRGVGMKTLSNEPKARTSFSGPVEAWQP
jgi:hypothetical protein